MRAPARALLLLAGSAVLGCAATDDLNPPYWPTPMARVEAMLTLAEVTSEDVVYDLGSGDGRIPIAAAELHGARAVGIEIEPALVRKATRLAAEAGVGDRVRFVEGDIFESDFSEATVVTLYLWETTNERLKPLFLKQLAPDARIVTFDFEIPGWTPVERDGPVALYRLPLDPASSSP